MLTQHALGHWEAMNFFLRTDTEREGESPLQALRAGRRDAAVCAARMYGEHGGGVLPDFRPSGSCDKLPLRRSERTCEEAGSRKSRW